MSLPHPVLAKGQKPTGRWPVGFALPVGKEKMGKSKKKRFAELAAGQVDDGQVMIEGVKPVSLGERLSWMASRWR